MMYDPLWLHVLHPDAREEVVQWLDRNGVETRFCAQFQTKRKADVVFVACQMYAKNSNNEAYLDAAHEPVMGTTVYFDNRLNDLPTAVRARETA